MSSPAKRRRERLTRKRRTFQELSSVRKEQSDTAWRAHVAALERRGYFTEIVTETPINLKDVSSISRKKSHD